MIAEMKQFGQYPSTRRANQYSTDPGGTSSNLVTLLNGVGSIDLAPCGAYLYWQFSTGGPEWYNLSQLEERNL